MAVNTNEQNNKSKIHYRPILSLLIGLTFFTAILIIAIFVAGKDGRQVVARLQINKLIMKILIAQQDIIYPIKTQQQSYLKRTNLVELYAFMI